MTPKEVEVLDKFITILNTIAESDKDQTGQMLKLIINTILKLKDKDRFSLKFEISSFDKDQQYSYKDSYGYYSSFTNSMVIFLREEDFNKRFFGLITDYNEVNDNMINSLLITFPHEIMHYISNNASVDYINLWDKEFRIFLWTTFEKIIRNGGELYYEGSEPCIQLLNNSQFKKAFNIYYNIVIQSIKYKWLSYNRFYEFVIKELYDKIDFHIARLFDSILVNTILLGTHKFNEHTMPIYYAISQSYEDIYKIPKSRSLHYQELITATEISSILSTYWRINPHIKDLVMKSLQLV